MHLLSGMAWDWRDQASQPRCQLKAEIQLPWFLYSSYDFYLHSSLFFVLNSWSMSKQVQTIHFTQLAGVFCFCFVFFQHFFNMFSSMFSTYFTIFHHFFCPNPRQLGDSYSRSNLQRTDQPSHATELQSANGLRLRIWRWTDSTIFFSPHRLPYGPMIGKLPSILVGCFLYTHLIRIPYLKVGFVTENPHWRCSFKN